jgi:hypothetical protein
MISKHEIKSFPLYGWLGLLLVAVFWILNWSLSGLRTQWGFFFLWFGYALAIDGIVFIRKGSSLLTRNKKAFILLFVISSPSWWLFEFFNTFTQNWLYDGRQYFTDLQFFLLASLSFSTVMPAVFGTAELVGTFKWIKSIKKSSRKEFSKYRVLKNFMIGIITLYLIIVFPAYFYPLIWIAVYLIIQPINILFGNRTLYDFLLEANWRPFIALSVGCLICGFFWEMWNYLSYPKWIYNLPHFNFVHVFEMPILGYIGYIPFSLELFEIYHFITGIFGYKKDWNYINLIDN